MVSEIVIDTLLEDDIKSPFPLKSEFNHLASEIPFNFNSDFINFLSKQNGGMADYIFKYYDAYLECVLQGSLDFVYGFNRSEYNFAYDIIKNYHNPPEFFPKNLLAFGETGNGDRVCFDYRTDIKTDNPPIVYWKHDAGIGQDVSFVANNFEEFIKMLEEPEDDDEIDKS